MSTPKAIILDLTLFMFNKDFKKSSHEVNYPSGKTVSIVFLFTNVKNRERKWVSYNKR